jgi:hypothetical protein
MAFFRSAFFRSVVLVGPFLALVRLGVMLAEGFPLGPSLTLIGIVVAMLFPFWFFTWWLGRLLGFKTRFFSD